MIRGFLSGAIWGSVVSALGLGAVSQLTPLPVERIAADATAVQRVKPPVAAVPADPVVATPDVTADNAAETKIAEPTAKTETLPAVTAIEEVTPVAPAAEVLDPPAGSEFAKPLPDVTPVLPKADDVPVLDKAAADPLAPLAEEAVTQTDTGSDAPKASAEVPKPLVAPEEGADAAAPAVAGDDVTLAQLQPDQLLVPQPDTAPDLAPAAVPAPVPVEKPVAVEKPLPQILPETLPETLPVPEPPAKPSGQFKPDPVLIPENDPAAESGAKSAATLQPTPELKQSIDGVVIGRLPRIGDPAPATDAVVLPAPETNPGETAALVVEGGDGEMPPLKKYARQFENPDEKPLFSIILIDTGGAELDRAALAALPFPVTFALDPLAPNVAEASKIYRDAGQEIIMIATGIPAGATASDLEVTFGSLAASLPEAVAVIDTEFGSFQSDRPLATQVVPILKAQGRGLISWDRGLNAADQVARRDGLAAGMVFRKLDGKGENKSAVRRALDRAAFKAAQDGRVMVIGQTLPETVAALQDWATAGRVSSVALAPVSATLTVE